MVRLRVFFAVILVAMFFPMWRGLDYLVVLWPSNILYALSFTLTSLFFLIVPLYLWKPSIRKLWLFLAVFSFAVLGFSGGALSDKATKHFELRQCGFATFTGFIYHARVILPPAHQDDIEARNQFCWIRKMIVRMPAEIDDVKELQNYLELLRQKLLSPSEKYKASLPLIAVLHGKMSARLEGSALESVQVGKMFLDSLHFWKGQYTTEISAREYPWYAWPHSTWVKWEYGLIEKNWESIIQSIQVSD